MIERVKVRNGMYYLETFGRSFNTIPTDHTHKIFGHPFFSILNCKIAFDYFHYDFEDQNSGKMIERAKVKNRLYYLDGPGGHSMLLLLMPYI